MDDDEVNASSPESHSQNVFHRQAMLCDGTSNQNQIVVYKQTCHEGLQDQLTGGRKIWEAQISFYHNTCCPGRMSRYCDVQMQEKHL